MTDSSGPTLFWTPCSWFWGWSGQRLQVEWVLIFPACLSKMENSSQRFPLATSIVSRRSSRSYSHQTFWRPVKESTNLAKIQQVWHQFARQPSPGELLGVQGMPAEATTKLRGILICCLLQVREEVQKKSIFFLGKSPKLWVGGGQES